MSVKYSRPRIWISQEPHVLLFNTVSLFHLTSMFSAQHIRNSIPSKYNYKKALPTLLLLKKQLYLLISYLLYFNFLPPLYVYFVDLVLFLCRLLFFAAMDAYIMKKGKQSWPFSLSHTNTHNTLFFLICLIINFHNTK